MMCSRPRPSFAHQYQFTRAAELYEKTGLMGKHSIQQRQIDSAGGLGPLSSIATVFLDWA